MLNMVLVGAMDGVEVMSPVDATLAKASEVCSLLNVVLVGITADVEVKSTLDVALGNTVNNEEASLPLDTALVDVEDDIDVGFLSEVMGVCSLLASTLIEETDDIKVTVPLVTVVIDAIVSAETCSVIDVAL